MALNFTDKQAIVSEVSQVASTAVSMVAANYSGLSVAQMTKLRNQARDSGVYVRVVRNTLARKALADTSFVCASDQLVGQLILAFSKEEPGAAARVMRDFVKQNNALEVKFLSIGGALLAANRLEAVAKLPSKDEAIAQLMAVMQAPIAKLAATIREPHAKLVRLFAAVKDNK